MNYKKIIPYKLIQVRRKLQPIWRKMTKKNIKVKERIPILHLHLTDHCNLNCRGCDNFSSISPKVFAEKDVFEKDCAKMAQLAEGNIDEVQLLGGEPLLHPDIEEFLDITRKYFPNTPINIVTNGILITKMKESFWESCRKNKVNIVQTKYPINLDFKRIENHVKSQQVVFSYYGNTEVVEKTMMCMPLDLEGKQNPKDSFLRCARANRCVALDGGKVYTCSLIPYVKYFNRQFNKNLEVTPHDYLDIYKAKNLNEVLTFVSKPVPFCRFCDMKNTIWDIPFGITKKNINEWTIEK